MSIRVRFKTGFPAYEKGKVYFLPEDVVAHYVSAGAAEVVEMTGDRPKPEQEQPDPPQPEDGPDEPEPSAEDSAKGAGDEKPKRSRKKKST